MAKRLSGLALFAVLACMATPALATPLEEKQNEWSFDISWVDVEDEGSTTNIDGQWQWIFAKGHHEVGALLSYLEIDPDGGDSTDATILGPVYSWNWFPAKAATGYLTASYGIVSGDLSDSVDGALHGGVGAKVFVGDSAAVRFEFFLERLMGEEGFEDVDIRGVSIGISIFTGNK